jgi:hypothetical protein
MSLVPSSLDFNNQQYVYYYLMVAELESFTGGYDFYRMTRFFGTTLEQHYPLINLCFSLRVAIKHV